MPTRSTNTNTALPGQSGQSGQSGKSGDPVAEEETSQSGESGESSESGFAALGLDPAFVSALTALGYEEPTPIQTETIPALIAGKDVLGQAATGTGKTAAFSLPILQRLHE